MKTLSPSPTVLLKHSFPHGCGNKVKQNSAKNSVVVSETRGFENEDFHARHKRIILGTKGTDFSPARSKSRRTHVSPQRAAC